MTLNLHFYPKLVRILYNNLKLKKYPLKSINLCSFHSQKFASQSVCFEGNVVYDWKIDYSSYDSRAVICIENANMTYRLLIESMKVKIHVTHYIMCHF